MNPNDLNQMLQQQPFHALKALDGIKPQHKELDTQLTQINQTIANLVGGLGKAQMQASPSQLHNLNNL